MGKGSPGSILTSWGVTGLKVSSTSRRTWELSGSRAFTDGVHLTARIGVWGKVEIKVSPLLGSERGGSPDSM